MAAPSAAFFRTIPENSCAWFLARVAFPPVNMAARAAKRLGPQLVQIPLASRSLHCSPAHQACGRWREKHGFSYNPSLRGPITDLPDWSFADGRPAPPMKGQLRRQEKNEAFARRAVMLSEEIDHALEKWEAQKKEQEQQAEEKRHNRLMPKGSLLRQTSK